jgi:cyclase
MANLRLIARLDVKAPFLIKGIHLEGVRKLGNPGEFARRYYDAGIDEILYIDAVASLYERNHLTDLVRQTVRDIFVPITVGGGIRSVEDAREILRSGADKVAVNTAATKRPELISDLAGRFGAQCTVLSIEAKKKADGAWEAYTDNGRERTGLDVVDWAMRGVALGAGEILLTSVDREGTGEGFDVELVRRVAETVAVPVIASGGMGTIDHFLEIAQKGRARAVAMADVLHYDRLAVGAIREAARENAISVRQF